MDNRDCIHVCIFSVQSVRKQNNFPQLSLDVYLWDHDFETWASPFKVKKLCGDKWFQITSFWATVSGGLIGNLTKFCQTTKKEKQSQFSQRCWWQWGTGLTPKKTVCRPTFSARTREYGGKEFVVPNSCGWRFIEQNRSIFLHASFKARWAQIDWPPMREDRRRKICCIVFRAKTQKN